MIQEQDIKYKRHFEKAAQFSRLIHTRFSKINNKSRKSLL